MIGNTDIARQLTLEVRVRLVYAIKPVLMPFILAGPLLMSFLASRHHHARWFVLYFIQLSITAQHRRSTVRLIAREVVYRCARLHSFTSTFCPLRHGRV